MVLGLEPMFEVTFAVAEQVVVGEIPDGGVRRITDVIGGEFIGPALSGTVLTGQDVVTVRPDGAVRLNVRVVLRTDSDECVYMAYQGLRAAAPEYRERLRSAQPLPEGADYFRCSFTFETAALRVAWLNDIIAVGAGRRDADRVVYDVHKVT